MSGVDVIVVSYRTPDDLQGFLESFDECRSAEDRLHIVLVDPDVRCELVSDQWSGHPALASSSKFSYNCGYGRACNEAAAHPSCTAEILGCFNADTRLTSGLTAACRDALLCNPAWAIVGPRQVDDHGRLTHAGITGTSTKPMLRGWRQPDRGPDYHADEAGMVSVSGSAYLVRRAAWDELTACSLYQNWMMQTLGEPAVGAMLETPLYFEDMWCSAHARAHGWDIAFLGSVCMTHRFHKAVEAAGQGEPTAKYREGLRRYRSACDAHGLSHE